MRALPILLVATALAVLVPPAPAATFTELQPGDQLQGTSPGTDPVVIPILGTKDGLLTVKIKSDKGAFPDLRVLLPDRTEISTDGFLKGHKKGKKVTLKKLPLPVTGRYFLLLSTQTASDFQMKTKLKPEKKAGGTLPIPVGSAHDEVVGAMPGSLLSVKLKSSKRSALEPRVESIVGPDGDPLDLSGVKRKTKGNKDVLKKVPLPDFGAYSILLTGTPDSLGDLAKVKIKIKHAKPRKAKLVQGDLRVDPFVDTITLTSAFDNQDPPGLSVVGSFFQSDFVLTLEQDGGPTIAPVTTSRPSPSLIAADFDFTDEPVGVYDVVIRHSDGTSGRIEDGFTLLRAPRVTGVAPNWTWDGPLYRSADVTISGDSFASSDVKVLFLEPAGSGTPIDVDQQKGVSTGAGGTTLTFGVNAWDRRRGVYDVVVENPDGGRSAEAITLEVLRAPRPASLMRSDLSDFDSVFDNEAVTGLLLDGSDFTAGAGLTVEFIPEAGGPVISSTSTTVVSGTRIEFDADFTGAAPGTYRVEMVNGGAKGGRGILLRDSSADPKLFTVLRAPVLQSVVPARGFAGESLDPIDLFGTDFEIGATIRLTRSGETDLSPDTATRIDSTNYEIAVDLAGVTHGAWSVDLTNPDGGRDVLADSFHVLGDFGIVEGAGGAGEPAVAYHTTNDEYLAVWTREDSGDRDVRARLYSARTGQPVGGEILVAASASADEDDAHVVFDPDGDRYLVVYVKDGKELRVKVIDEDGTLTSTDLSLSDAFDERARPRVVYNPDRTEFLVVFERRVPAEDDIPANWDVEAVRIPAAGGFSESTLESFPIVSTTIDEREPDVGYDPFWLQYVVVWVEDREEVTGETDTGFDVLIAKLGGGDISLDGPTLLTVASETEDERRPRIARNPDDSEFALVWERHVASDDHDLIARRYDPILNGSLAGSNVTVEETSTDDARSAAILWDGGSDVYRVVYVVGGADVVETRLSWTLGSPLHTTLATDDPGDSRTRPALGVRGTGGELFVVFGVDASGLPNRDLEGRFAR